MNEVMLQWLKAYPTQTVEPADVIYREEPDGTHRLLVLPNDNIEEHMEEAIDTAQSTTEYVSRQSAEADTLSLTQALARCMAWLLESSELPANYQPLTSLSTAELYEAYRYLAELEGPRDDLDEQLIATDKTLPAPDASWTEERAEDGALWLTLPQGQEYYAPLIIPMGGFNECPEPLLQSAVFREWQQQYHAMPIAVNDSTWILRAPQRPQTDEQALNLAREHTLFCPYVLEGFDTIGEYASYLKQRNIWYFWWD